MAIERLEAGDPSFWKMMLGRVWPTKVEISAEADTEVEFRWRTQDEERDLDPAGCRLPADR